MFSDPFPIGSSVPEPPYRYSHLPGDRQESARQLSRILEKLKKTIRGKNSEQIRKEIDTIQNNSKKLFHIVSGNKAFSYEEHQLHQKFQQSIEDLVEKKDDPRLKEQYSLIHPYLERCLIEGNEWLKKITS